MPAIALVPGAPVQDHEKDGVMNGNEIAAIEAVVKGMTSAFASGDIDRVLRAYEAEAVVVGAPGNMVTGHPQLRTLFQAFVAEGVDFSYGGHEVVVAGDLALHLMQWSFPVVGEDGGPERQDALSVAVLRRQSDGSWRMVVDHPFGDGVMNMAEENNGWQCAAGWSASP